MNKKIISLPGVFFVCSLLLTATISAQKFVTPNGGGTIVFVSGNIQADGANLPDATVNLINEGFVYSSGVTDADGNYSIQGIAGNTYTVSVYKEGFNFNPTFQFLSNIQLNQTVNFQNGVRLCIPAPTGQTGENYCQTATTTDVSRIENGKIAFEIFRNAFAINADGSNQMQLPPAGAFPSWSFDGTKLLSNRSTSLDADQEIYISNADGTGNRQITFNFFNDYKANWSPDGTRAVFYRLFNSSDIEIFSINTDSPNNGIKEIQLTNDNCLNRDPSYSPDGTKIVFSKFCENGNASGIYTMNTDGTNPVQLTVGNDSYPAWRPDGARIIFARDGDLWFVNPSGTSVVQLTFDLQIDYYSPVYSPDGEKIAFSRVPGELQFQEIYTLNPFTGEQLRLTNNQQFSQNKEYPSWQRIVADVQVTLAGGVNLTFSNVTTAGNTVVTPIELASAGALPPNFTLILESVAYDVRTSASFSGDAEICFDLPNVSNETVFNSLVILHNENGELIDRTSSRNFMARKICATVASFSPFIVAAPLAPTAANVSISGKVTNSTGESLANAEVILTDSSGNSSKTRTSSFGFYRFEDVEAGQVYVLEVHKKRYRFIPQIITINEEISELNFIAEP